MHTSNQKNGFAVTAYRGDAKTLLAFDLAAADRVDLAGFSIQCAPAGVQAYYLLNNLRFKDPARHAQVAGESPNSSANAPIHKFRWLHVPGSAHQGTHPVYGDYTYTVTPRYFDGSGSLLALDPTRSVAVAIDVAPFVKLGVELGFARGFTQSQAFVHHFGRKAIVRPKNKTLVFDTSAVSGKNDAGESYTFAEEYEWLGWTARDKMFAVLDEVANDAGLRLDVFAYDLNEPDVIKTLLKLAGERRVRVILDNAGLHHDSTGKKPEDQFEKLFVKASQEPAPIVRGKFARYAHDKVFIVSRGTAAVKVLTGSTNLSVTGVYVNSNHVIVFNDPAVAAAYAEVFEKSWALGASSKFAKEPEAAKAFSFQSAQTPATEITFSPHQPAFAKATLDKMVERITHEGQQDGGSVLFAVMDLSTGTGPVFPALAKLHKQETVFSYGISDSPGGICLYTPRKKTGVLVTGKPAKTVLPPPFDQVPGIGAGHQVHHKFVVCGFNGAEPVVYCGSSNLAEGGEEQNGDNLIAIHDGDIATVFAIEALSLVDHFDFLDRCSASAAKTTGGTTKKGTAKKPASEAVTSPSKQQQADQAGWFLSTTDKWTDAYFDPDDLHAVDRELFAVHP